MGECVCDNWRRKEKAKRDKCTRQRWAPKIEGGQIEKTVKESIVISVFFSPYKMNQSLKRISWSTILRKNCGFLMPIGMLC